MAKNESREFATMSDDERRRFALEQEGSGGGEQGADELELGDPRNDEHLGRQYASLDAEVAEGREHCGERHGVGAEDLEPALVVRRVDEQHARRVEAQRRRQGK